MENDQKPVKKSDNAYDRALKLLNIRTHTSFELARKLKQKGFSDESVDEAINRLKEERFLKDDDTAYFYAESLISHKTFGYYGMKSKMMQKGLPNDLIEKVLAENLSLDVEEKIARKYLEKSKKDGLKAMMGLKSKGFRSEVINKVIER